ncbi:hypothetical protein E4T49_06061 [Aureobasidium sp. EXF-10728]|nr:hypothetical protein E4T49_06061 [Aureobasidium sp. EXF-10728]
MSTRQTRSRSRGRPAGKYSQPARPLSRIRPTAQFSDPDYDQSTPEPKTASTPSPSWGVFGGNKEKILFSKATTKQPLVRNSANPASGDTNPDWKGTPSVSLVKPDGGRYYMSSFCAPASHSPKGDFQDRISRSNSSRAKAMASPTFGKRSSSRPKRVEISSRRYDEDQGERMRSRSSPTWRKTRPDTPSSTRASIFDFPSERTRRNSPEGFVPRSGFIWLVLIFLGIFLGLSSPPTTNSVQVAYKEVCNRFGNPAEWNCNGNFNFTIDNVISHCQSATDKIYDKFQMLDAKANVEDLMHSCQSSINQGTDKLGNIVEGVSKKTSAKLKKSLCALPGAEIWSDCAKKPAWKLRKTFSTAFSTSFSTASWDFGSWKSSKAPRLVKTIETTGYKGIAEGTHAPAREHAHTPAVSTQGRAEAIANSVGSSLASQANSYATSKLSSASSAYLPFSSSSSSGGYTINSTVFEWVSTQSTLSDSIETVNKIKDLELKYALANAKAELKMLQKNDIINFPAIRWNPLLWGRGEAYWYRERTQKEREESLRLHRLRVTLHQVRDASAGFEDIKNLTEHGIISLLDTHNDLNSHSEKVLEDPTYGLAFFKEKLPVVKKDLALAIEFRDERKRVKNHINAVLWDRYNNGNDEHAVIVAKEMRL